MGLQEIFSLYTVKDVATIFPENAKVKLTHIEDLARTAGCYREVGGVMLFTQDDVRLLLEHMAGRRHDEGAGPARLLNRPHSTNEPGYIVFIGDQIDHEVPVFIGWAPADARGASDLLALVQYGYPGPLAVIGFASGTPAMADAVRTSMSEFTVYMGAPHWFARTTEVEGMLLSLRTKAPGFREEERDNGD